jgi:hypothetical protein
MSLLIDVTAIPSKPNETVSGGGNLVHAKGSSRDTHYASVRLRKARAFSAPDDEIV